MKLLINLLLAVSGFSFQSTAFAKEARVAVSFSILEDITKNLLPSDFKVDGIVSANQDTHGFEPMTKHFIYFKRADHIILVGENFEPWATKAISKVRSKAKIYYVTKNAKLLSLNETAEKHDVHGVHHHGLDSKFDPHFWLSPEVSIPIIEGLSLYLQSSYPASSAEIKDRTNAYVSKLKELQIRFKQEFSKIPENERQMIIAHNSFQYFGKEFQVKVDSPLDAYQEGESTLQKVSSLIKKIKDQKIKSLFYEKSSSESLLKSISKETGVKVSGVLYSDCLSDNQDANTYLKMLEYNFSLILKSMKGQSL